MIYEITFNDTTTAEQLEQELSGITTDDVLHISIGSTYPSIEFQDLSFKDNIGNVEINLTENENQLKSSLFSHCNNLKSVVFKGYGVYSLSIGATCFYLCNSLSSVIFEGRYKPFTFGNGVFRECTSLEKIDIPNDLGKIPDRCFYGCSNLKEIVIPESVTNIGETAFYKCVSLTGITSTSDSLWIDTSAFTGDINLVNVTINGDISYLGRYAFSGCDNLKYINYYGSDRPSVMWGDSFPEGTILNVRYDYEDDSFGSFQIKREMGYSDIGILSNEGEVINVSKNESNISHIIHNVCHIYPNLNCIEVSFEETNIGDVCVYDGTSKRFFRLVEKNPTTDITKYTPIGIVITPTSHNVYEDNSCGVVSLAMMNRNSPDTGSLTTSQSMYIDSKEYDTREYLKNYFYVGYGRLGSPIIGLREGGAGTCGDSGYDSRQNLYDTNTYYSSEDGFHIPSPFNTDDTRNFEFSKTEFPSSEENINSQFDANYYNQVYCSLSLAQPTWKTDESILTPDNDTRLNSYYGAQCCWRYHTIGTNQGEWYLPTAAELCYYHARSNKIEDIIRRLNSLYGYTVSSISDPSLSCIPTYIEDGSTFRTHWYVTSSEFTTYQSYPVRAFIRVYNDAKTNEQNYYHITSNCNGCYVYFNGQNKGSISNNVLDFADEYSSGKITIVDSNSVFENEIEYSSQTKGYDKYTFPRSDVEELTVTKDKQSITVNIYTGYEENRYRLYNNRAYSFPRNKHIKCNNEVELNYSVIEFKTEDMIGVYGGYTTTTTIEDVPDWITMVEGNTENNQYGYNRIDIEANTTGVERIANIKIVGKIVEHKDGSPDEDKSIYIKITQAG